jgi:hypothetical protein
MLITKIYLAAMSRADLSPAVLNKTPNFYLFVDEFQSFANESFADILSEARKYKLNLTIAHQYIEQMSEEVRAAVFGNVGTMVTFRVGAFDAEVLEKEFSPYFTAEDLVNLGFVQIYLKLMIDGVSSHPFSAMTLPPIEKPAISFKQDIIKSSRDLYARSKVMVEHEIKEWHKPVVSREVDNRPKENREYKEKNNPIPFDKKKETLFNKPPVRKDNASLKQALAEALKNKPISKPKEIKTEERREIERENKEKIKDEEISEDNLKNILGI